MDEDTRPVGDPILPPVQLSPTQDDFCEKLDDFFEPYNLKIKPSDMFRGALFVSQSSLRGSNPDWISQACGSLREILYPLYSREVDGANIDEALVNYGSVQANDTVSSTRRFDLWKLLNGITHHGSGRQNTGVDYSSFTPEDFDTAISDFEIVMSEALVRQVDVHGEIDSMITQEPPTA
jgi:hypothetical protein